MKRVNYILLLIGLLLCAVLVFGCADPDVKIKDGAQGDRVEEDAKGKEEKKENKKENKKEEKQEETTGEDTADAEVTTDVPEETTAKPVVTTKPADTTAKPVVTTTKPVETTAKPAPQKEEGPDVTLTAPSADTAKRMAADYAEHMKNEYGYDPKVYGPYPVWYCYGSVNGAYAVIFGGATHVDEKEYPDGSITRHIKIWKNGNIYTIKAAMKKGVLTEKQLNQLEYNRISNKFVTVTKPYSDVYVPNVEKPSDDLIEQIEKDYTQYLRIYDSNCEGYVVNYYGQFGDCVPCLLDGKGLYYTQAVVGKIIAGGSFTYSCGNTIKVWKDGEFYTLEEAFENSFLSVEEVLLLSKIHATGKYYKCR